MGTEISLDIGGMSISWAKNDRGTDHGCLFQPSDRKRFPSQLIDYEEGRPDESDLAEMEIGFTRPLGAVLPRLELLGYTVAAAQDEYAAMAEAGREMDSGAPRDLMPFEEFLAFLKMAAIDDLDAAFVSDLDETTIRGRFKDENQKARIPWYSQYNDDAYSERSYFGSLVRFLHPYTLLRLLAENPPNLALNVDWQYGPLVSNGWAEEGEFEPNARRTQTYLIATEGSSDTHILNRAFQLLRPAIADFFRFIDVRDGHPFSGTGSLVKFAEGLAKIDVQNRTIFLLDNDAEGVSAFRKIDKMILPLNMRALTLPTLDAFENFPTIGPEGEQTADINGRAAAIECY
ncbi:MAG: hypothetical protein QOF41_1203 [Methylobacteriaceae bacterium]|nr:hypothetical protein [Methylobacteriaceae bacterium]